MANIPAKVKERFIKTVKKYQKILITSNNRDINEADTVTIINEMLYEIFGYDKFEEITKEFTIKNTYCDLAIKIKNDVKFLIEVKAIGIKLNDNHIKQATNYGANQGLEWIVLTNGIEWIIYKMSYGKRIAHNQICSYNFLDINPRNESDQEKLFILCKEGLKKDAIEEFHAYKQIVNKFYISAIIQGTEVLDKIRKELKKTSDGIKLDMKEVEIILKNEVLKRDVIDSDEAQDAIELYKKNLKRMQKNKNYAN